MIEVKNETKKYMVNPRETIERAFEGAYVSTVEKMPQTPPDYLTAIWGSVSIILVAALYFITGRRALMKGETTTLWYALSAVLVAVVVFVIYKLIKNHNLFKKASGGEDKKEAERKKFYDIMDYAGQPAEISATEYAKKISPMIGRQPNELCNMGVRKIADYLGTVNNPSETSCKLLTPFGDVFNQSKKRFYMSHSQGVISFTDFDFNAAKGEITCSEEDIRSFGYYSNYPNGILPAGTGKVHSDAVLLELDDGTNHLIFEFLPQDLSTLKKAFGGKYEIK